MFRYYMMTPTVYARIANVVPKNDLVGSACGGGGGGRVVSCLFANCGILGSIG